MSWAGIANNQTISNDNLQDAINTGVFAAGITPIPLSPSPVNKKQVTKSRTLDYITVPNPSYPLFASKASNQLVVKEDIYAPGDFTLDPLNTYYQIDSVVCTGIPSFSYPVTTNTTLQYNGIIPSQTISVSITSLGPNPFTDANVSLYVNGGLIATQSGLLGGGTASLSLPFAVASPSDVRIAVSSGSTPPDPNVNVSFSNTPVNGAAISKTTGQYQFVTEGETQCTASLYFYPAPYKSGYIYTSTDYGVSWSRNTSFFDLWKKIVCSDDGQYVMAIPFYGYPVRSSDYGATFANMTALGQKYWSGISMSASGDRVTLTSFTTISSVGGSGTDLHRSIDYGVSWGNFITFSTTNWMFSSVTMDPTGQYQCASKLNANIYYSSDYGANWTTNLIDNRLFFTDLTRNDSGINNTTVAAYVYADFDFVVAGAGVYQSTNYGSTWSSADSTSQGVPYYQATNSIGTQYAVLYNPNNNRYIKYRSNASFFNLTSAGQEFWQCFAVGGGTTYMLGGHITGLKRSGDSGSTWQNK